MDITKDICYVGVNDHELDLFEGQFIVPQGMAYNSYIIKDEKIAVMDSVDARFSRVWLDNIRALLSAAQPAYLIVQHMEPDHSGSVRAFMETFPDATVIASAKAFAMMKNFFGKDFADRRIVVAEGDVLNLGRHTLRFISAPMVHWPEVIMTYDDTDKVLFSADGFGKFGALDTAEDDWACEARRYYFGIVGKYGASVQALLKKVAVLDVKTICPLHGPVLTENLKYYIDLYNTWSGYAAEEEGIVIAYTSIYGNTKQAALRLAEKLGENGCLPVTVQDLARCDMAEAVEDAFRYSRLVLAAPTYNADVFPAMREFIHHLTERNYSNRMVAFVENGSWAPSAIRAMKKMLEECKNLVYANTEITILSAPNEETEVQLDALARELMEGTCAACPVTEESANKKFICKICGYVYEGECLPEDYVCPLCRRGAEDFEEMK